MLRLFKTFYLKNKVICILAILTFIGIVTTACLFYQPPLPIYLLKILPLFISLSIMFMQAQVNRYAFLMGGLNSILYAVSYIFMQLYTSAAYAFLVSFPLQVMTFISWNRKTTDSKTELRKMTKLQLLLLILACLLSWVLLFVIFSLLGSPYVILDNTTSLLGIVTTILCMLRFVEYPFFQIAGSLISIVLHCQILTDQIVSGIPPAQSTYLIYTLYATVCTGFSAYNMRKQYKAQKTAML